ncbi:UDP pyrophosphate phosphatase [Bacillus coahuilensis m2-6]|uniref:Undecaprenyl-diphosphatase n=1 Tax=Bacillus coahuilensis p1.1.43 TaxID=1150625 RepID=A0A147K9Y4_9BACI|nr:undecaprenyl-diphosphate phosphatase [Bacillus coahuilensis]KUP07504.1 UDP pyrophosphate phosphatase [Bacillus coahuilensis p1.1.43]KUP09064.1 UDP pyrophosphate phosphatase [Bacillus coahuilensis m2-6]
MSAEVVELLKYLFLGIFQGFTEPIPISSSGHLKLAQHFFDLDLEGLTFEIIVNTASLFAVLLIYREDILRLVRNGLGYLSKKTEENKKDFDFILYLIIGTIPAGVIGVLFGDLIEETFNNIKFVGATLIITGIGLWYIRNMKGKKRDGDLSMKDAIIVGLGQAVALMPGISRSGATIVAAMALGMKQETALRFSFLLFIPISLGVTAKSVSDILESNTISELWIPYTLGFIGSLIASYYSLKWFMNIMQRGNLKYFAYYCFIVGLAVLLFV